MIELGELFNRCIPMEVLLQFPRKFVSRLRDLRRLQKQRQLEQHQQQMNAVSAGRPSNITHASSVAHAQQVLNTNSAFDDLVDELS